MDARDLREVTGKSLKSQTCDLVCHGMFLQVGLHVTEMV